MDFFQSLKIFSGGFPALRTVGMSCKKSVQSFKPVLDRPGLPDGFFSNQKSKFGQILEGLRWENVDIF
jgi:hypothetical protein